MIKTGISNLGSGLKKRVPRAYIGYTSDGTLLLKTITTQTGQKIERWYQLGEHTADAPYQGRVKMARGVDSVYWQFELTNIDGADFEIDTLQLYPVAITRRIK